MLLFQSTPPVKAATLTIPPCWPLLNISIHAAREGGDFKLIKYHFINIYISIHAAREGGDIGLSFFYCGLNISIHAAREGGDRTTYKYPNAFRYFNPRRP